MKNMTSHHQILFWADKCDKIRTNQIITEILYRRPSIFFTNQGNSNRDLLSFLLSQQVSSDEGHPHQ